MSTFTVPFLLLAITSLVNGNIESLELTATLPELDLPQILVKWTDTTQNPNYQIKLSMETNLFTNQSRVVDSVISTVKEKTFVDLEFSAKYKIEVNALNANGAIVGTAKTKSVETAKGPQPVVKGSEISVLMVFPSVAGVSFYELLVMKVDAQNQPTEKPVNSPAKYVAYYVDASISISKLAREVGTNDTSGPTSDPKKYRDKPLVTGEEYVFSQHIRIGNESVYFPWSDKIKKPPTTVDDSLTSAEIVAIIVGVTAAIIGLAFIIICCFNWKYSLRYKPQPAKGKPANPIERLKTDPAIPVTEEDFFDHVIQMKLHNFKGFYEEFSSKKSEFQAAEAFRYPGNQEKNRYFNIPCYDHSRVELAGNNENETYIHANFVPGAYNDKEYIYTQSPLPETISDFWTMVWQQDSSVIVMIGEMIEKGKQECAPYFPTRVNEAIQSYCLVKLCHIHNTTDYSIRTLTLSRGGEEKELTHYQYIGWPISKMTPEYSTSFLQMVLCVSKNIPDRPGRPIVVHGTNDRYGRAGIYICIDAEIQRFLKQGDLSVFGTVMSCRSHRHDGVKTLDEYIFIHDTVLEAVLLKSIENVPVTNLPKYIEKASKGPENKHLFATEFNFLTSTTMTSTQKMAAASLPCNIAKNRYANVKPYDYNRVKLSKLMNEEGSDYINASYIDTYNKKRSFIAAQAPLVETIADFWRMINENESWVIIMLGQEIENGQLKANRFWPEEGYAMSLDEITIKFISISRDVIPDVWIRQMELLNKKGERKLIQFYQYHSWPSHEQITSQSIRSLVQLVNQSQSWLDKLNAKRITVVSSAGIGRPGVLIGLSSLQEEADCENHVNVFRTVQKLNQQRPSLVQSREEYALMYTSTLEITEKARRRPVIKEEASFDDGTGTFLGIEMVNTGHSAEKDADITIDMEPVDSNEKYSPEIETPTDEPDATDSLEKVPRVSFQVEGDDNTEKRSVSRANSGTHDSHM